MSITLPLCSSPSIIFNRGCVESLYRAGQYYWLGEKVDISPVRLNNWLTSPEHLYRFFQRQIKSFYKNGRDNKDGINIDNLNKCYISDNGQNTIYLFQLVSCGHCDLCHQSRQNDFSTRVTMESSESYTAAIMVTLTYAPKFLPVETLVTKEYTNTFDEQPRTYKEWELSRYRLGDKDCPSKQDVQRRMSLNKEDITKFIKRLRRHWEYRNCHPFGIDMPYSSYNEYIKDYPFRYCVVGEYGSKFGRPHYHCLFWNVPYNIRTFRNIDGLRQLKSDIVKCWGMSKFTIDEFGFYDSECIQCDIARNAGKYVGKYLSKENKNGRKGTFQCSNRGGGLGAKTIDKRKDFFRSNPTENKLTFVSANGSIESYTLGRYATRRLFPTPSLLMPDYDKQQVKRMRTDLSICSADMKSIGVECFDQFQTLANTLNPYPSFFFTRLGNTIGNPFKVSRETLSCMTVEEYDEFVYQKEQMCRFIIDYFIEYFGVETFRNEYNELISVKVSRPNDNELVEQKRINTIHNQALGERIITKDYVESHALQAKLKFAVALDKEKF